MGGENRRDSLRRKDVELKDLWRTFHGIEDVPFQCRFPLLPNFLDLIFSGIEVFGIG